MATKKHGPNIEYFYPRPPRGGRPCRTRSGRTRAQDFYPRPPRGGRRTRRRKQPHKRRFLSTPSARRATILPSTGSASSRFLSTPSARRATLDIFIFDAGTIVFLSTPSARRATHLLINRSSESENFYPRPPRGGRRWCSPPRQGGAYFYPRPPRGGRRGAGRGRGPACAISIPALREEGDDINEINDHIHKLFLSPPSARRATMTASTARHSGKFLSPPSARRATKLYVMYETARQFLSPPSARRATPVPAPRSTFVLDFYPRPPRGGRRGVAG